LTPKWLRKRCYIDGVASLTLKDVPERVHEILRKAAAQDRRSLNAFVISLLEEAAEDIDRRRRNYESRAELRAFVASLPEVPDPTPLIREDRER
jgi:uncharacterized protein (DUF1778 family)